MSEPKTLARPYAIAAYRYAQQQHQVEAWSDFLHHLCEIVEDTDVQKMLYTPNISVAQWQAFLRLLLKKNDAVSHINFLRLLIERRRLPLAPLISHAFETLKAEAENCITVTITTAIALTTTEKDRLITQLTQKMKKKILPDFIVDTALIAGVVIAVGEEYIFDGSLMTQLTRLKTTFHS